MLQWMLPWVSNVRCINSWINRFSEFYLFRALLYFLFFQIPILILDLNHLFWNSVHQLLIIRCDRFNEEVGCGTSYLGCPRTHIRVGVRNLWDKMLMVVVLLLKMIIVSALWSLNCICWHFESTIIMFCSKFSCWSW